jgi:hypothetical protein
MRNGQLARFRPGLGETPESLPPWFLCLAEHPFVHPFVGPCYGQVFTAHAGPNWSPHSRKDRMGVRIEVGRQSVKDGDKVQLFSARTRVYQEHKFWLVFAGWVQAL